MKTLWHISRVLLGLVFIFSGFVKGIDPWGSAYKFADYFAAWGMEALTPLALPLGILLSSAEFIIGTVLVANVFISFFSVASLLFVIFFAGLTFFIALYNPVTDCGCFGDALKLTNWQTFLKNLLLLALAVTVFRYRKNFAAKNLSPLPYILSGLIVVTFANLVGWSYNHLPIIDFLPFKVGTNIPEAMSVPENASKDVYKNTFFYKNRKTGETRKFTEENYPWQDSLSWEFVSMDTKLMRKGYEPPIRNFTMESNEGEDQKEFFLYDPGYTFIFVVYDQEKADVSNLTPVRQLAAYAGINEINFIGLTSATPQSTEHFKAKNNLGFDFLSCDQTTLKTMIRSNPGLILLRNGVILDKWHYNDFPSIREFENERAYLEQKR
ncbi:MAG: BT_3928 family protein [Prolixibacteraceae bacterium]